MSRLYKTKKKILESLSGRPKTMTDLSRELELSPSTIKQHLVELNETGAIRIAENTHVKKWKYYTLAPRFWAGELGY